MLTPIPPGLVKVLSSVLALCAANVLCFVQPTRAHGDFEITSTARLQHDRLEVAAIMTLRAGGLLLEEGSDPEFALGPDNFERYRGRLQSAALGFYEVTAGGEPLAPLRASVVLPEAGHLRFTVVYPQPAAWPLKFRPAKVGSMPASAISDLGVYDQEEKLLGANVLRLRGPGTSELSVDPLRPDPPLRALTVPGLALASPTPPVPPPVTAATASPAVSSLSWLDVALGAALGLVTLGLVVSRRKVKTSPTV